MILHIPFDSLYFSDNGWLQSRFHFSFAEYIDYNNKNFGPLRVMNDDIIKAKSGFGTHPHQNMEIITYVLSGKLSHKDSMEHKECLDRGCVQYMSAGTGITHSEINEEDENIHLIQIWILPDKKGLTPSYGSKIFTLQDRHNRWLNIVGPYGSIAPVYINQDAYIFVSEIDANKTLDFNLNSDRAIYLKVMEGSSYINGITFLEGDAAKIVDENLHIESISNVHILLVEISKDSI